MQNKKEIIEKLKKMQSEIKDKVEAKGYSKFLKETGEHLPSPSTLSKYLMFDIYGQIPRNIQVRVIRQALENDEELILEKLREFGVFTNKKVSAKQKEKAAMLANMYFDNLTNDQKSEVFFLKYSGKGTFIHELMEDWFDNGFVNPIDDKYKEFEGNYQAAVNFIKKHDDEIEPIFSEVDVWDKDLGTFGRLDFLCIWNNKLTIVDWKTNANLIINLTAIQLYIYKMALRKWGINVEDITIVKLQKDGTFKIHTYDHDWYDTFEEVVNSIKMIHDYKNIVKAEKI